MTHVIYHLSATFRFVTVGPVSRLALPQLLPADVESLRSSASSDAIATGSTAAEIVQGHNENCYTRCVTAKTAAR